MPTLKYLINSTRKNKEIVLKRLIDSFRGKVPAEDIVVVMGGCEEASFVKEDMGPGSGSYYALETTQNSIDFTALIAAVEHKDLMGVDFLPTHWFYIHDTCEWGENYYERIEPHIQTLRMNKPLTWRYTMNIGIYAQKFLEEAWEELREVRSAEFPCAEEVQHLKRMGVGWEDRFFRRQHDEPFVHWTDPTRGIVTIPPRVIYEGGNVMRITEYFMVVDLYKYKANWELKETYELAP